MLPACGGGPDRDPEEPVPAATAGARELPQPILDRFHEEIRLHIAHRQAWHAKVLAQENLPSDREAEAHGELAQLYHAYDLAESAQVLYDAAERLSPDDHRWPHLRGYLHREANELELALAAFGRAVAVDPEFVPARVRRAEVLIDSDRPEEARVELESILAIDPGSAVSHFHLGLLLTDSDRLELAAGHLERALELQPDASAVRRPLGLVYRDLSRSDDARRTLSDAGDVEVSLADPVMSAVRARRTDLWTQQAKAGEFLRAGNTVAAREALEAAIAADSLAPEPRLALGQLLLASGDGSGGLRQLELAVFLSRSNPVAHALLAQELARQGRWEAAVSEYGIAVREAPDDGLVRYRYGELLLGRDRPEEAVGELRAADRLLRGSSAMPLVLEATALGALGRCDEARDRIESALGESPRNGLWLHALARLLAACGGAGSAPRALELALDLFDRAPTPGHAGAVARAHAALGARDEAVRWQERAIVLAREREGDHLAALLERDLASMKAGSTPAVPWRFDDLVLFRVRE